MPAPSQQAMTRQQTRKHDKHKAKTTQTIHKRSTALQRSANYFTGGLQPASRVNPAPSSVVHQDTQTARKTPIHQCTISQNTQNKTQKEDKAKTRTQQFTRPKTGAKEIHQVNPCGSNNSQSIRPKHLIKAKSLNRNHHRARSPTHRRAIKEESKVANRDWVDHQACNLLQYINALANPFIVRNYFNKLR